MTNHNDRDRDQPSSVDTTGDVTVITTGSAGTSAAQPQDQNVGTRTAVTEGTGSGMLEKISDTALSPADPRMDIRGRTVIDRHGDDIGHVNDLLIDREERRVRFLEVGAGGFLGLGERHFLVPVEAVTAVEGNRVRIDRTREHITGSPEYDPQLTRRTRDDYAPYYGYYGLTPYWGAGYTSPYTPLF